MEFCYYDQEYCMDTELVLQTYRNNIKVVFLYLYFYIIFICFINLFTLYTIKKSENEFIKQLKLIEKDYEFNKNKNKKSWFIDYSVE